MACSFYKICPNSWCSRTLDQVKVKMKKIDYTVHQKMMTLLLSVVIGCRYTSDINQKLVPDTVAANLLDMDRFPDQSQVNELLRRIDNRGVEQAKSVHHQMFMQNAQCLSTTGDVVVDIDQSGLIANGKTYEMAQKGYFSKKKNQKGYQLSAAFCGNENSETISLYLDPSNTHCSTRFEDLVKDTLVKLSDVAKDNRLILRMDSGYGSDDNIRKIQNIVLFIAKAFSTVRAANIAKSIKKTDWEEVDGCVDLYELANTDGLRHVIVRTLTSKGNFEYTMLVTNIPVTKMSSVFITHNLLSWFKSTVLSGTKLENTGTKTMVDKLGSIVVEVRRKPSSIEVILPQISALARKFVECLQPKYEQLSLLSP